MEEIKCTYCKGLFSSQKSKKRKYCSINCFYKSGNARNGKKHSPKTIKKFKQIAKDNEVKISRGWFTKGHTKWKHPNAEKNWFKKGHKPKNWQGGKRTKSQQIKDDVRYSKWRKAVFERDNYMCVLCGNKKTIQPDHIFAKIKYPEKAYDINNGRTLCDKCHRKTPNYGGKALKYENPLCEPE